MNKEEFLKTQCRGFSFANFMLLTNMLKNLVEGKLPTNLVIIQDCEEIGGEELFVAFLKAHAECETKRVHFVCYENPPEYYLKDITNTNIIVHNFFCDPCGWNSKSSIKFDTFFFSKNSVFSDTVFFIDSLSALTTYNGLCAIYKCLWNLKSVAKQIICLAHGDLLNSLNLSEFQNLSSALIVLKPTLNGDYKEYGSLKEKFVNIIYKKIGGKVVNQVEIYYTSSEFKIVSEIGDNKVKLTTINKNSVKNLTTFKITCDDKKAKDQSVLPFLRPELQVPYTGKIMYKAEVDDLEDDPDDDLNI